MDTFYKDHNIPAYLCELLSLMGVVSLRDLLEIDEDFVDDIETQVRAGNFASQVDFSSRQNRMKYFGIDLPSTDTFRLRPLDRKKLLNMSELARSALNRKEDQT